MTITRADRDDIQALLRWGYPRLRGCDYWLLRVGDRLAVQRWLAKLLEAGLIKSASQVDLRDPIEEAVTIAFTHEGLVRLGIRPTQDFPFPTAFREGMGNQVRGSLLRDGSRACWEWSDVNGNQMPGHCMETHMLVIHNYLLPQEGSSCSILPVPQRGDGFETVRTIGTCPSYLQADAAGRAVAYEPFGFRDSLSQPTVYGIKQDRREADRQAELDALAPGEFVLGHRNEYGELSYAPDVEGWRRCHTKPTVPAFAHNGTYLAVRQIEQNIAAFAALPTELKSKIMGREPGGEGTPLAPSPGRNDKSNEFRYKISDDNGFHCPLGAHVRRANPRDLLGTDVRTGFALTKLHRLMRRGRPYIIDRGSCEREPMLCGTPKARARGCASGLFFVACNADLERQFEFVQGQWLAKREFDGLADEDDPLVGHRGRISVPKSPIGTTVTDIGALTETVGGGYFFAPGIQALKFISALVPPSNALATTRTVALSG